MIAEEKRRLFGEHPTPIQIFENFILPEIKGRLNNYVFADLFAGSGNLILPILKLIPEHKRAEFFSKHIYLFDIQKEMVEEAIKNAENWGIPRAIAEQNIIQQDTIKDYPEFLLNLNLPVFHITNPPYLNKNYIAKREDIRSYLDYFNGKNKHYQDLYQLALANDLCHGIKEMIYIIPTNFLFGRLSSYKIRDDLLQYYNIKKAIIFEKKIFEHTGVNVSIFFFERKKEPKHEPIYFDGIKINREIIRKSYILSPQNHYHAGGLFDDFIEKFKASRPLDISLYLMHDEVEKNKGEFEIDVIDANDYNGSKYNKKKIFVNKELYEKIKANKLFLRAIDSGSIDGRAGIYKIKDIFDADGILVSKAKYRTHPIQIFIEPRLSDEEQNLLMDYFNTILEYFRKKTDSEFMTTYRYSNTKYTRKWLGLTQAKKLIQTFPLLDLANEERAYFKKLINSKNAEEIISFLEKEKESLRA